MSINTELFQKIYDQIAQHPETHNQAVFEMHDACGTVRCVAGWAITLEGRVDQKGSIYDGVVSARAILTLAAELLGLSEAQANELFYAVTDAEAVELCHRYATKGDEA